MLDSTSLYSLRTQPMMLQHFFLTSSVVLMLFTGEHWRIEATHDNAPESPPVFASQHPNVYVFENDNQQNLILPCSIAAPSSTVEYTWYRGNERLPGSMVNGEGTLVIPNITEGEYAGREGVEYYCIVSDNIGYVTAVRSRNITVYHAYFDGFERMTENTIEVPIPVAQNSDVALECDVLDANPPPQIKWYDDQGEVQEIRQSNNVRFLDNKRYLFIRRLQPSHLEQQYYCSVSNANLSQEVSAPTRYVLIDNLTQGELIDYKQIGDLIAFVGNTSFEFAYVGGVYGDNVNGTINTFSVNSSGVSVLENVGIIHTIPSPGHSILEANVLYNGFSEIKRGTLTINQIPRITNYFQDEREHLVGEDNLKYTCEYEGFPLLSIAFYFNGAHITASNIYGVNIVGNILTIPSPQVSHSGVYQCIVSNEFGDDQAAWLLEIRQPISPQVLPYNLTALDAFDDRDLGAVFTRDNRSTVSFSVDVIADPCPDIVWNFNGTSLGPSNGTIAFNNPCMEAGARSLNWTFTLNFVLTAATSGSYCANFINIAGSTYSPKAYFTSPEPISVTSLSLNETCLKEGSSIAIRCNIRGFPRPSIEFQQDGSEIIPEEGMFKNILREFYDQITIKNVTMSAEGWYSCIATSTSGLQPQITQQFHFCTVPRITAVDLTPNPRVGEPFFIECTVDGIPMPNTVWMKDGTILESYVDNGIRIVTIPARRSSRVEVSRASVEFNGVYQCIVSNDAGFVMHPFMIDLMQVHLQADGDGVASLGLIIGITSGVAIPILLAVLVILVLMCVICRLYVCDKSSNSQSAGRYSFNIAYLERLRQGNIEDYNYIIDKDSRKPEAPDPMYETIPDINLEQAQAKDDKSLQIYEKAQTYDQKICHNDIQLVKQLEMSGSTCEKSSGAELEEVSTKI